MREQQRSRCRSGRLRQSFSITRAACVIEKEHINTPKDFEGKVYAGWQAPSEEAVIKAVMKAAKADFSKLTMVGADGSGFASLGKTVDIQWEFEGWAVTKGRMEGYDLKLYTAA